MDINKEILIYHSLPYKKYRWISYMSIIQVGFLALNLLFLPTPRLIRERQEALANRVRRKEKGEEDTDQLLDEFEPNPDYDPATLIQRIKRLKVRELFTIGSMVDNISERPFLSTGIIAASILVSSAFWMYARRTVHQLTLLPNGRIRFAFFSPFAITKPPFIEVPLRNVSCVQPRKSQTNYSVLKIKGYRGYHLVHKGEGQFLEPKLYDKHLGYQRVWSKKP